jgi:hypothetical protein
MSGHRLRVVILIGISLSVALLMVILNIYPSWSQYALSAFDSLLTITDTCIALLFWDRASLHPDREDVILKKLFGKPLKTKHLDRFIAIMFVLILATPVTLVFMKVPHYLFTGLAALASFFHMVLYYRKGAKMTWNIIGAFIAALGFLLGLLTDKYTTGLGELIFAGIMAIHVLATNKKVVPGPETVVRPSLNE